MRLLPLLPRSIGIASTPQLFGAAFTLSAAAGVAVYPSGVCTCNSRTTFAEWSYWLSFRGSLISAFHFACTVKSSVNAKSANEYFPSFFVKNVFFSFVFTSVSVTSAPSKGRPVSSVTVPVTVREVAGLPFFSIKGRLLSKNTSGVFGSVGTCALAADSIPKNKPEIAKMHFIASQPLTSMQTFSYRSNSRAAIIYAI